MVDISSIIELVDGVYKPTSSNVTDGAAMQEFPSACECHCFFG